MKVVVTALQSRIDARVARIAEEAARSGISLSHLPRCESFFAEVERGGKRELWPISEEDAERVATEVKWRREEEEIRPGSPTKPLPLLGSLTMDLPEPSREQTAEAQA